MFWEWAMKYLKNFWKLINGNFGTEKNLLKVEILNFFQSFETNKKIFGIKNWEFLKKKFFFHWFVNFFKIFFSLTMSHEVSEKTFLINKLEFWNWKNCRKFLISIFFKIWKLKRKIFSRDFKTCSKIEKLKRLNKLKFWNWKNNQKSKILKISKKNFFFNFYNFFENS